MSYFLFKMIRNHQVIKYEVQFSSDNHMYITKVYENSNFVKLISLKKKKAEKPKQKNKEKILNIFKQMQ